MTTSAEGSNNTCSICLESLTLDTAAGLFVFRPTIQTECRHTFHVHCLRVLCQTAIVPKCPLCRTVWVETQAAFKTPSHTYDHALSLSPDEPATCSITSTFYGRRPGRFATASSAWVAAQARDAHVLAAELADNLGRPISDAVSRSEASGGGGGGDEEVAVSLGVLENELLPSTVKVPPASECASVLATNEGPTIPAPMDAMDAMAVITTHITTLRGPMRYVNESFDDLGFVTTQRRQPPQKRTQWTDALAHRMALLAVEDKMRTKENL